MQIRFDINVPVDLKKKKEQFWKGFPKILRKTDFFLQYKHRKFDPKH